MKRSILTDFDWIIKKNITLDAIYGQFVQINKKIGEKLILHHFFKNNVAIKCN